MNDDDPLDLAQVAADHEAVERLRGRRAGDLEDDVAIALLRDLACEVEADLRPSRTTTGTTIVSIAGDEPPSRRLVRGGTVISALVAGLVALASVAAASTLVPAGAPLHGLGSAVRSAAGAVVDAVTPPDTPGPAARPARPAPGAAPVERPVRPPVSTQQRPTAPVADVAGADLAAADRGLLADRLAALRTRLAETRSEPGVQPPANKPKTKAPAAQERKNKPARGRADGERQDARSDGARKAPKGSAPDAAPPVPADAADRAPAATSRRR